MKKNKTFAPQKIKGSINFSCPVCGEKKCEDNKFCEKEIRRIMNEALNCYE
jgi:hypothetical protein